MNYLKRISTNRLTEIESEISTLQSFRDEIQAQAAIMRQEEEDGKPWDQGKVDALYFLDQVIKNKLYNDLHVRRQKIQDTLDG